MTDYCFICGKYTDIEMHHVFGGPYRKASTKHGFIVPLCHWCHNEPPDGVHFNRENRNRLKQIAQREFERTHTRDDFRRTFGKSYLEDGND